MDENDLDNFYYKHNEEEPSFPLNPLGDMFEDSRVGDVECLEYLLELGVNVNVRDTWEVHGKSYLIRVKRL
jgi:hypothetical protein